MKVLEDWAQVQTVYKLCGTVKGTANKLKMSRNTVSKLLRMTEPPIFHKREYSSVIDPFKEQIITWRCDPYNFNGTRIFRELKELGYSGSKGPLYRYLTKIDEDLKERISNKATTRHESPCGDQAQFDWSEYDVPVNSVIRKVYCFSMILAASRKKAVCFSLSCDADAIYEAIQELFDDLGGVTLELLIDNPKALVIENKPRNESEIKYNPAALMLAAHLGMELNACPCYWPRKKGKIERPFDYIEQQFINGKSFASMEDLNRRGKEFVNKWCDEKHTTTKRIPNVHYLEEEKATLLPLPKDHYYVTPLLSRKVSNDLLVSVNGSKYMVPAQYATKTVRFRLTYGFRLTIFDKSGKMQIAQYEVVDKGKIVTDPECYKAIAPRVSTSIPQIRRDFTARYSNGLRYLESAGQKFQQPTHHARKILELGDLYDDTVMDKLIGIAVDTDRMSIDDFRMLLREYNGATHVPTEQYKSSVSPVAEDPLIRTCSYYESCNNANAGK